MVLDIDSSNFASSIAEGIAIIDFWAPWCAPCKMMAPVVDKIAQNNPDILVGKVDIDECKEIAKKYNILSIPTLIIFKNGEEADRTVGVTQEKKIMEKVNAIK